MTLEHTLDQVFSLFIRLRDADEDGIIRCPCCGAKVYWKSADAMHYVRRSCHATLWSEWNVNAGCFTCNRLNYGELDVYAVWLDNKYGPGTADELRKLGRTFKKYSESELRELIAHYRSLVRELKKKVNCSQLF